MHLVAANLSKLSYEVSSRTGPNVCPLGNKLVCHNTPMALTGMSMDKMQRQRKPREWRIAGTNGPIRERDFFQLRLAPHHRVAESIHTPLYRPSAIRNIIQNAENKYIKAILHGYYIRFLFTFVSNHLS